MKRMKQRGQGGLRDVVDYEHVKNMTEEEEEEYWDSVGELGYDGEHEMRALYEQHPHQHMNDMTRYQDEVIDLIDDEEEDAHSKSPKRSKNPQRSKSSPKSKQRKRPNESMNNKSKKMRRTENGEEMLEEMDEEEKIEMGNLEQSLETLLGKYLPKNKPTGMHFSLQ